MRDSTGRYTYVYDERSQMKLAHSPPNHRITYSYDALGQRAFMIAPTGGRFTYSYDAAGQLSLLVNPEVDRTSFSYDSAGRKQVKKLANGTRASFSFDAAGQTARLANLKSDGTTISSYDYNYSPSGNRTRVIEESGDIVTWTYDKTSQLLGEHRSGPHAYRHTFTYDPLGNRLVKNEDGTRTTTTYDIANQIRYSAGAGGRTTYTFDAAGNQQIVMNLDSTRVTTTWDYENQPIIYELADHSRITMTYNSEFNRTKKESKDTSINFIWDEFNYLVEMDESGSIVAIHTSTNDIYGSTVSRKFSVNSLYPLFDECGSARIIVASSTPVYEAVFGAFGEKVFESGGSFNMEWNAESALYPDSELDNIYARQRQYDPDSGRFLSIDPLWISQDKMYAYSNNNPVNMSDPSGRETVVRDSNGKIIVHPGETAHGVGHVHIEADGASIRVDADGNPLKGEPKLGPKARAMVRKYINHIRREALRVQARIDAARAAKRIGMVLAIATALNSAKALASHKCDDLLQEALDEGMLFEQRKTNLQCQVYFNAIDKFFNCAGMDQSVRFFLQFRQMATFCCKFN